MRYFITALSTCLFLSLLLATPAAAEIALGVKVGTQGVGPEASFKLSNYLNLRAGLALYDQDIDYSASDVEYDGNVDLFNVSGLLDWYPAGGGFRLSVGAVYNENEVRGEAPIEELIAQEIDLPDLPFDLGTLRGSAQTEPLNPYVGIGFGNPFAGTSRWRFSLDLGVVFQGDPEISLEADVAFPIEDIPGGQEILDALIEEERQALEEDAEDYDMYPVVAIGVGYRF